MLGVPEGGAHSTGAWVGAVEIPAPEDRTSAESCSSSFLEEFLLGFLTMQIFAYLIAEVV